MPLSPLLVKAKQAAVDSGLTYVEIGQRMGHPPESARQSVEQFFRGKNPSLAMLIRFAAAVGVDPRDLI